jgi:hypothetical protein
VYNRKKLVVLGKSSGSQKGESGTVSKATEQLKVAAGKPHVLEPKDKRVVSPSVHNRDYSDNSTYSSPKKLYSQVVKTSPPVQLSRATQYSLHVSGALPLDLRTRATPQRLSPVAYGEVSPTRDHGIEIEVGASVDAEPCLPDDAPDPCILTVSPSETVDDILGRIAFITGLECPIVMCDRSSGGQLWCLPDSRTIEDVIHTSGHTSFSYDLDD